jgi:hypothetical protein
MSDAPAAAMADGPETNSADDQNAHSGDAAVHRREVHVRTQCDSEPEVSDAEQEKVGVNLRFWMVNMVFLWHCN